MLGEVEAGDLVFLGDPQAHHHVEQSVDLDGAASDDHVGFLFAKQVAKALLRGADLSLLSAGVLVPAGVEQRRNLLAEVLGVEGVEEALRDWPSGNYPSALALRGVEALAEQTELILWIDHVEVPRLTPRHPLKPDRLLWGLRELSQRHEGVRLLVSAREAADDMIVGSRAAFHQLGLWLSLDCPTPAMWREVADQLNVSPYTAHELASRTGGHPRTMLLALATLKLADGAWPSQADDVLAELTAHDDGVARRAVEHAQSLHRLGGQVLIQVARAQRPYKCGPESIGNRLLAPEGFQSLGARRQCLGRLEQDLKQRFSCCSITGVLTLQFGRVLRASTRFAETPNCDIY